MTENTAIHSSAGSFGSLPSLRALPARVWGFILARHERARQRRALASLDDRMLKEVGLTRAQAGGKYRMQPRADWPGCIDSTTGRRAP